ncbi:MAG: 50S ribosomal protein L15 [Verrucomicrobiota bacterium]|jgi:large subunit ribosomal protein L15|nr:50S ribosomal protein L15 [Verrucomicrobiota bacterium]
MRLHDLQPKHGARHRRKRIGRGRGSGQGKTSGRGHKGQKSRAGSGQRSIFEGGQMPLNRRLPKRGFNNARFGTVYLPVNLKALEDHFEAGARVDEEALRGKGLANGKSDGIKILGTGKLTKQLTVVASAFSTKAREAIEAAGGACEVAGA